VTLLSMQMSCLKIDICVVTNISQRWLLSLEVDANKIQNSPTAFDPWSLKGLGNPLVSRLSHLVIKMWVNMHDAPALTIIARESLSPLPSWSLTLLVLGSQSNSIGSHVDRLPMDC
jgi:hypothetical protein